MKLSNVSLVIIDTMAYNLSFQALTNSLKNIEFGDVLIYSDDPDKWGGLSVKKIDNLNNINEYSHILFKHVPEDLKTDYFLVIQYDGFVINPSEFSPHYFHYDYIGAPWAWHPHLSVGNGGFSWRSRKLAEAVCEIYDQNEILNYNEDEYICRIHRVRLEEEYSCHFSPIEIASHFSVEHGARRFPTFGFHGIWHLPIIYGDNIQYLIDNLPPLVKSKNEEMHLMAEAIKQTHPDFMNYFIEALNNQGNI